MASSATRCLCDLGTGSGTDAKTLLIRFPLWPQPNGTSGPDASLVVRGLKADRSLTLRPVVVKQYDRALRQPDGKYQRTDSVQVFQQDLTGLLTIKQAIVQALKRGEPQAIWQLFYNACKALDEIGHSGTGKPVSLLRGRWRRRSPARSRSRKPGPGAPPRPRRASRRLLQGAEQLDPATFALRTLLGVRDDAIPRSGSRSVPPRMKSGTR